MVQWGCSWVGSGRRVARIGGVSGERALWKESLQELFSPCDDVSKRVCSMLAVVRSPHGHS
jgi:hypothetical protein